MELFVRMLRPGLHADFSVKPGLPGVSRVLHGSG
jgi:hypothetical protein